MTFIRRIFSTLLIAVICLASFDAQAWRSGIATTSTAPTGKGFFVAGFWYNTGEYPLIDFQKMCRSETSTNTAWPSWLDSDGYPNNPAAQPLANNITCSFHVPFSKTTTGDTWVWQWDGAIGSLANPGMEIGGNYTEEGSSGCVKTPTSSQMDVYGTNCRIEFHFNAQVSDVNFKFLSGTTVGPTFTNSRIFRKAQESYLLAGQHINPDYIAKIVSGGWRGIRVENWINLNSSTPNIIGDVAQETPVTAFTYGQNFYGTAARGWAGDTTGTNNYVLVLPGITSLPTTVMGRFVNASSASPTLQVCAVAGCGSGYASPAIQMANVSGGNLGTTAVAANSNWAATYDAVLNKFVAQTAGIGNGIPTSLMIETANLANIDLYFNMPMMATRAYNVSLFTRIRDGLHSNLTLHAGWGNEVWNNAYPQTGITTVRGQTMGMSNVSFGALYNTYSLYAILMWQDLVSTFAATGKTNYKRVLEIQAGSSTGPNINSRFNGNLLVTGNSTYNTLTGSVSYNVGPSGSTPGNRPIDQDDELSYAPYYNGAQLTYGLGATTNYQNFSDQTIFSVTAASNASPAVLTMSAAVNGTLSDGQRVRLGQLAAGFGTNFVGGTWNTLNGTSASVKVTGANTIALYSDQALTVPIDGTGLGTWSSGGAATRYGDEMTGLVAAATAYATSGTLVNACNGLTTPIAWVDCDLHSGTNYGLVSPTGNTLDTLHTNVLVGWQSVVTTNYSNASRVAVGLKPIDIIFYEDSYQGAFPVAADCTALGIDSSFCGSTGKIAKLLGQGPTPDAGSYKMSATFQATVLSQYTDFLAMANSKYVNWYEMADSSSDFAMSPLDLYSTFYTSFNANQQCNSGSC